MARVSQRMTAAAGAVALAAGSVQAVDIQFLGASIVPNPIGCEGVATVTVTFIAEREPEESARQRLELWDDDVFFDDKIGVEEFEFFPGSFRQQFQVVYTIECVCRDGGRGDDACNIRGSAGEDDEGDPHELYFFSPSSGESSENYTVRCGYKGFDGEAQSAVSVPKVPLETVDGDYAVVSFDILPPQGAGGFSGGMARLQLGPDLMTLPALSLTALSVNTFGPLSPVPLTIIPGGVPGEYVVDLPPFPGVPEIEIIATVGPLDVGGTVLADAVVPVGVIDGMWNDPTAFLPVPITPSLGEVYLLGPDAPVPALPDAEMFDFDPAIGVLTAPAGTLMPPPDRGEIATADYAARLYGTGDAHPIGGVMLEADPVLPLIAPIELTAPMPLSGRVEIIQVVDGGITDTVVIPFGDPSADLDRNGTIDVFDLIEFLQLFSAALN